jgi:hypothetical protein
MRSSHYDFAARTAIVPGVYAANADGAVIDRLGHESAAVVIQVGAGGDTFTATKRIDFVLEHSDDGATFEPVAGADLAGAELDGNGAVHSLQSAHPNPSEARFSYIGGRRYLRASPRFNGTHAAGTPISALVLLGRGRERPVA